MQFTRSKKKNDTFIEAEGAKVRLRVSRKTGDAGFLLLSKRAVLCAALTAAKTRTHSNLGEGRSAYVSNLASFGILFATGAHFPLRAHNGTYA